MAATATAAHARTPALAHPQRRHLAVQSSGEQRLEGKAGLKPPLPAPLTTPPPAPSSLLTPRSRGRQCGCSAARSSLLFSPPLLAPHPLSPSSAAPAYFLPAGSACTATAAGGGGRVGGGGGLAGGQGIVQVVGEGVPSSSRSLSPF